MCLCYLPDNVNAPTFQRLRTKHTDEKLKPLFDYMHKTWISHKIWAPHNWSVYETAVRTNNDIEGWHNRLNRQGRPNMAFYLLIDLLKREADFSADVVRLLSGRKVRQHRRKDGKQADARLCKLWKQFHEGEITVRDLLKSVAGVAGPVNS